MLTGPGRRQRLENTNTRILQRESLLQVGLYTKYYHNTSERQLLSITLTITLTPEVRLNRQLTD